MKTRFYSMDRYLLIPRLQMSQRVASDELRDLSKLTKYQDSGTKGLQRSQIELFFFTQLAKSLASPFRILYRGRQQQLPPYHTALVIVHTISTAHTSDAILAALLHSPRTFNRFYKSHRHNTPGTYRVANKPSSLA
jgi:hypothetical protein